MTQTLLRVRAAVVIIIGLCTFNTAKAQWITLPDPAFAEYLTHYIPNCINGTQLDTTCTNLGDISRMDFYQYGRTVKDITGVKYLYNLGHISNNGGEALDSLPELPPNLYDLSIFGCHSGKIPPLPASLLYLELVNFNPPMQLPDFLPDNMMMITLTNNGLRSLPPLPTALRELHISNNNIDSLELPPLYDLTYLECNSNNLRWLPYLPPNLQQIDIMNNMLDTLPDLPPSLRAMEARGNLLKQVKFAPTMTYLGFRNNLITSLPPFPNNENMYIDFVNNKLTSVPAFPNAGGEYTIYLDDNMLTSIPALPDTLAELTCNNNVNLTCLPELTTMRYLHFENTAVTCVPNYGNGILQSWPLLDSVPLCDIYSANNCLVFTNISGHVYKDENNFCLRDTNDRILRSIKVQLWKDGVLKEEQYTGGAGGYAFKTGPGNFEVRIDTTGLPFTISCPAGNVYYDTITAMDSLHFNRDFGTTCTSGFDAGIISIVGRFRPALEQEIYIQGGDISSIYNASCNTGTSATVIATITGPAKFTGVAPSVITPSSVSDNTITWAVADLSAIDLKNSFNVLAQPDTNALLNSQVCITVIISPTTVGDINSANDTLTQCFAVRGSYDPNEKSVSPPAGNTDPDTKWLAYTVQFQNTGTDTAYDIYIIDTLDANVDASTFQLLDYSHKPMVTEIKSGNIARFTFPHIMLPDSNVNEKLSHGYVQYRVQPKKNLPLGTQIKNTAYIYFDFNAPVVTNTTVNTLAKEIVTAVSGNGTAGLGQVNVYPNPTVQQLNIVCNGFAPHTISISDINGRKLSEQSYNHTLDVSTLAPGIYFVEVRGEGSVARKRFVKE